MRIRDMTLELAALVTLAQLRLRRSRRDIGRMVGRDPSNLTQRCPRLDVATRLADALGWPLATLANAMGFASSSLIGSEEGDPLRDAVRAMSDGFPMRAARAARRASMECDGDSTPLVLVWSLALRAVDRRAESLAVASLVDLDGVRAQRAGSGLLDALRRHRQCVRLERGLLSHPPTLAMPDKAVPAAPTARRVAASATIDPNVGGLAPFVDAIADRLRSLTWIASRVPADDRAASCAWLVDALVEAAVTEAITTDALLSLAEATVRRHRRLRSSDVGALRQVSHTIAPLLARAADQRAPIDWHGRMRLLRIEATRRRLVDRAAGVRTVWSLAEDERRLVVELIGRFPAFRRVGLRLLVDVRRAHGLV